MLVALYTIFVLGGGVSFAISDFLDELKQSTKDFVVDDEHKKEALDTIKAMKALLKDHQKGIGEISKPLGKELAANPLRNAEVDKLWDQYIDLSSNTMRDMVELRFQLKDQLTRDEWEQVFSG
jgi:hypothetical protein